MASEPGSWESPQLREIRADLARNPELCGQALAVLGELAATPEEVIIRTDAASVDVAIARALTLAVNGTVCGLELHDADR